MRVLGWERVAVQLLDFDWNDWRLYPLTIHNLLHVLFFVGLGELVVRWRVAGYELSLASERFLPEDDSTVLQSGDLGPIRRTVAGRHDGENGWLPQLIELTILQFQASRSVDQAVTVLNSSLELISHRVDLRYSLLRYVAWVIPTVGFIGTVAGIAGALDEMHGDVDIEAVTPHLAVAFNTTLIALIQSAILVVGIHAVQAREEGALNRAGDYTLRNLINRLYSG